MSLIIEIDDLRLRIQNAIKALDLAEKEGQIKDLEAAMNDPDFWSDNARARAMSQKLSSYKRQVDPWRELEAKAEELRDLADFEDSSLGKEIQKQLELLRADYAAKEFALKLSGPYDSSPAILSIHAGTGGTDAMDWAQMLQRMYVRFAESQSWDATLVDQSTGDEAGIKSATLRIEGDWAYGKLKGEHGVHRLVRLSPFNSDNLRQTSFALVEVVPEIEEPEDLEIDENELKVDVYRAGGHGGQSVNTTDSAVRITHEPTSIVVAIQNERSQLQNKETALKILRGKLAQLQLEQHAEKISELKGPDVQAAWGNQIRNYVLHPYTLVKDSRTKYETNDAQSVLDGQIGDFIEAYLQQSVGED